MGKLEKIIAAEPPAPRVPRVVSRLRAVQREVAAMKLQIPERALAAAEGNPGGLAELHRNISEAEFEIACNGPARELAAQLDEAAIAAWKANIQALAPAEIVAGITKDQCCRRCLIGAGCVITGSDPLAGPCAHPVLVGALEKDRYRENPKIMAVYAAARAAAGVR